MSDLNTLADIENLPVTITYVGQTRSKRGGSRDVDQWAVRINPGRTEYRTDFFTGLGLRKPAKNAPKAPVYKTTVGYAEWEARWMRPVTPKVTDVLYLLLADATAADFNFEDWCAEYGYSSDSIRALNTYRECLSIHKELTKQFDSQTIAELRELLADY